MEAERLPSAREAGTPDGKAAPPARGVLTLTLDSPGEADAVEAALRPEADGDVPGTRAALAREGLTLTLRLEADDAGALRAAVNAYLRWARAASQVHALAARGPGSAGAR